MTRHRTFAAAGTVALAAVLALAAAMPAQASQVNFDLTTGATSFIAAPGEDNRVSVAFTTYDDDEDTNTPEVDVIEYYDVTADITLTDTTYCKAPAGSGGNRVVCSRSAELDSLTTIDLGDGNDEVREATPARDVILGGAGNDILLGNAGNDSIDGGPGNDKITENIGCVGAPAGAGGDVLAGGTGTDVLEMGSCREQFSVASLNGVADDGAPGEGDNIGGDIEEVKGGGAGTRFVGNDLPNIFNGSAGDDEADGGGGNDKLYGGLGKDTLNGGAGDDIVEGYGDADTLDGGPGRDDLSGEGGSTITDGTGGADTIFARDGEADTVSCGSRADRAVVDQFDIVAVSGGSDTCEVVELANVGGTSQTPGGGGTPGSGTQPGTGGSGGTGGGSTLPVISLDSSTSKVKAGVFPLKLRCGAAAACTGTVSVKTAGVVPAGKAKRLSIGSAKVSIKAGKKATVKVKLNKAGRKLMRSRKSLKVVVTVKLKGQPAKTAKVTLRR